MSKLTRETNDKIEALKAKVAELNKQVRDESQRLLNEGFADIFAKYPKLIGFSWNQYTPYFNDGDECTFRVNTDGLIPDFTDESAEESDYEYNTGDSTWNQTTKRYESVPVSKEKKLNNAAYKEICYLINAIDDDTMKATYGNHITVTVSKNEDGSIVSLTEDYDHD